MKYYKIFLLIFLFISCDNISVNYPTNNSANFNSAKNDTISQNIQYVDSTLLLLFKKIDLKQIKLQYGRGSTSTYLSNLNSFHFNNSDTVGFWGMYFLSNNYDDIVLQPYIAKVVVYVKSKSKIWEFSNNDEILYEITSCHPIINTISIINIGDSKEKMLKILGTPALQKNNFFFYKDDTNCIISFKLCNEVINEIKIGLYKSYSINEISSYILKNW